ncbi:hypothetical protein RRG08_053986 [Elysia crispata]|uniref:Uncharacterized protein n=1 Tax=Elysia crispata TaxID=231223 RepID=A0AAE1BB86_9GAST|nr:hypothetical protein RRG08_053986 [Elysia crispata]
MEIRFSSVKLLIQPPLVCYTEQLEIGLAGSLWNGCTLLSDIPVDLSYSSTLHLSVTLSSWRQAWLETCGMLETGLAGSLWNGCTLLSDISEDLSYSGISSEEEHASFWKRKSLCFKQKEETNLAATSFRPSERFYDATVQNVGSHYLDGAVCKSSACGNDWCGLKPPPNPGISCHKWRVLMPSGRYGTPYGRDMLDVTCGDISSLVVQNCM